MSATARCPECDYELWKARAGSVRIEVSRGPNSGSVTLHATDIIYCDRCRWWRPATADDLDLLKALKTAVPAEPDQGKRSYAPDFKQPPPEKKKGRR